jgi:hypothetical protein
MTERVYTINELKTLISESASEFKAKIGDGVASANEKENKSTYSTAKKKAKGLDGGGSEAKVEHNLSDKEDGNKTMLDLSMEEDCGSDFRDKVAAQGEGYTSPLEKKNGIEKAAEFSDATYKQFKKAGEEMAANKVAAKQSGLTARTLPKETFEKEGLYKESKKIAVLNFKNTTFLNESQMVSRIPDDYKTEGKRFKVKDAGANEFIVEWVDGEANILSYENKKKLNESMELFTKLSNYKSNSQFKQSTTAGRLNENSEFTKILNNVRIMSETK